MIIKSVIHYPDSNSVEATWVDRTEEQIDIPAVLDEEGNVTTPATTENKVTEVQVKCHSYSDRQMDMLRSDLGADASQYETLMAEVEANQKPIPPVIRDIKAEIAAMESTQIMPRVTREFMLGLLEGQYQPEQLAMNIGYTKLKAFDNEIKALRELL